LISRFGQAARAAAPLFLSAGEKPCVGDGEGFILARQKKTFGKD
jgi:hypothetical protein